MKSSNYGAAAEHSERSLIAGSRVCRPTGGNQNACELHPSSRFIPAPESTLALTLPENELMRHLGNGLLYKEIADRMGISFAKVHKLQHKIFMKLNVNNRTEAVNKWKEHESSAEIFRRREFPPAQL